MENNEFEEYQCEQDLTFPQQQHGRPLTFPVPQWTLANPQKQTLSRDASSAGPSRRPSSVSNSNSAFAHHLGPGPSFPIDPSLSNLSPFSGPSGSNLSSSFTDPITRFYHDSESPWIPVVTLGTVTHDGSFASYPNLPAAGLYRSAPPSEISSHDTAAFIPSDSGYGTTGCGAPSVISVSHIGSEPDYTDFPLSKVVKMAVTDDAPQEHDEIKESVMDSMKDPKLQHSPQRRMQLEKCKYCGVTPKCPSDLKKHLLKHEKPYMCGMAGCKRKGGFTTINDLLRHKKSVHKIGTTEKSYKCVAPGCKNRHKIWPRLDNFKQHVNRMHSEEDVYELIRRSQWDGQPSRSPTPRPGALVAPMETTLAGIDDHTKHTAMNVLHSPATYGISLNSASRGWNPADSTPQTLEFDDAQNESGEAVFAKARNAGAFGANIPLRSDTVSTASSTALSALAEVACGSPGMNPPDAAPRLGSGLPLPSRLKESDEERQKRALGRLSTVIANSISRKSTEESLNETILRVLSSAATGLAQPSKPKAEPDSAVVERPAERRAATQVGNGLGQGSSDVANPELDIESRDEVRQGLAALAALMKKQRGRKSSVGGRPGSALQSKGKRCPKCPLVFGRNCDLRKHLKRHERPYGCTYPKCNKSFGSKSDWKRHENSQHFQIETWRCQLYPLNRPPPEGAEHHASHHCGKLFFRSEHFKEHLGSEHSMTNESDVETQLKIRRIGRNGQGRFWCGFCHDIMELKAKRIEAWDERINHIDEHFKKGETSKHWWCMEAKKTKAEVEKQMDKRVFDDDEDDDDDEPSSPDEAEELSQNALAVEIDSDSSQGSGDDASYSVEPESAGAAPSESTMQSSVVQSPMDPYTSSKKRMISRDPSQDRKRKKYETMLFCCKCQWGPFPLKLHAACITCNHEFCTDCRKKPMRVKENEDMLEPLVSNY